MIQVSISIWNCIKEEKKIKQRLGYRKDILYYGKGVFDWVGFYSPIIYAELINGVYHVHTELGKYQLHNAGDIKKMRVKDVEGVSIFELQKLNEV